MGIYLGLEAKKREVQRTQKKQTGKQPQKAVIQKDAKKTKIRSGHQQQQQLSAAAKVAATRETTAAAVVVVGGQQVEQHYLAQLQDLAKACLAQLLLDLGNLVIPGLVTSQ